MRMSSGISAGLRALIGEAGHRRSLMLLLAAVVITAGGIALFLPRSHDIPMLSALLAGLIYVTSHVLRAIRLAFLSIDLFGISGRTVVAMHLATAPVSLMLPFKLGELLRLHELWRLSGTLVYSIVGLLIDRMYDSIFLVPLAIFLLARDSASPVFVGLTLLAAVLPLMVMVIGSRLLNDAQRYLVINHNNRRVLDALPAVNAARILVGRAAGVAWRRAPELCVISLMIWLCELLFCLVLVNASLAQHGATTVSTFDLLGDRLVSSWWTVGSDSLLQSALIIGTVSILLLWPFAITAYLFRRNHEPRRTSAALRVQERDKGI